MKPFSLIFILIASLLLGSCQTATPPPPPTPTPVWNTFCAPESTFSISVFGTPVERKETKTLGGQTVEYHVFEWNAQPISYAVAYFDWPAGSTPVPTADELIDLARADLTRDTNKRILNDKVIATNDLPGQEIQYQDTRNTKVTGTAYVLLHLVPINQRLYQVQAVMPASEALSPGGRMFLDSFQVYSVNSCESVARLRVTPTPTPDMPSGWNMFVSKPGKFAVLMPGSPQEKAASYVSTPYGPLTFHLAQSNDGNIGFGAGYTDIPEIDEKYDVAQLLDGAIGGLAQVGKSKTLSKREITLGDYPGREIIVQMRDSKGAKLNTKVQVFLVKLRLYMIMAAAPSTDTESPNVQKFFASFQLRLGNP